MSPFLLSFTIGIITIKAEQRMKLYLFPENTPGGQCLDGSPAGFYYSAPSSGSSNLWVIDLEGGGSCYDKVDCMKRANSSLGSSKYWSTTHDPSQQASDKINSNDPSINPDFYQGHQVYVPYCSGDCHSGQRKTPSTDPDTWGLYFSGHVIFENIIKYLQYNLSSSILDAEYILLTGTSAGGIGTFGNIQWLYDEMKTHKDNITIKAAPVGGWFFPGNVTDEPKDAMLPPNDYPDWVAGTQGGAWHNDSVGVLWDVYYNEECVAALGENNAWYCGSVHNLYPYISAPLFVLENKFEKNQITSAGQMPTNVVNNETIGYVEYYGINMDRSIYGRLIDEKNERNGLFYPSCFSHTGGIFLASKGYVVDGYDGTELVGDWFWGRNILPHYVYDTCNNESNQLPCNPTCPSYPPQVV